MAHIYWCLLYMAENIKAPERYVHKNMPRWFQMLEALDLAEGYLQRSALGFQQLPGGVQAAMKVVASMTPESRGSCLAYIMILAAAATPHSQKDAAFCADSLLELKKFLGAHVAGVCLLKVDFIADFDKEPDGACQARSFSIVSPSRRVLTLLLTDCICHLFITAVVRHHLLDC